MNEKSVKKITAESRYLISELLFESGYKKMAIHAMKELNIRTLSSYVKFMEQEAFKYCNENILSKMARNDLLS